MAMSDSVLSAALRAALLARPDTGATDNDALTQLCDAIAETVVLHIQTNADVIPTLMVAPPGGGPVTGTGLIV